MPGNDIQPATNDHESTVPTLRVNRVSVHFGGVKAVNDVSLDLMAGDLLGLVGPNGSGKSTLLGVISRLTRLDAGTLELAGTRYETRDPATVARMGIARTFQTVRLLPRFSVLENVLLSADQPALDAPRRFGFRRRLSEKQARAAALAALDRVHMAHIADADPMTLPYGVQRKVEIARALVREPAVLLFDEPIAGMSQAERDEIAELILELSQQGLAEILVEHDIGMIGSICTRLAVLNLGKKIGDGRPHDVLQSPEVQEAYLGGSDDDA